MTKLALLLSIALGTTVCSAQSLWVGSVTGTNQFNFTAGYASNEFVNTGSTSELAFYDHSASDSLTTLDLIVGFVNPPVTPPTITSVKVYKNVGNVDNSQNISASSGTVNVVNPALSPSGPTLLSSGKANSVLSMPGLSNSESTSNFDLAETKAGISHSGGYELYVYDLSKFAASFGGYGLLDITFSPGVVPGAVAFGWGCGGTNCQNDYTSVATQSGFLLARNSPTTVPEPTSIALFGTVALLTVLSWRKKIRA